MSKAQNVLDPELIMEYLKVIAVCNEILMTPEQLNKLDEIIHFDFDEWAKDWDTNLTGHLRGKFSMVLHKRFVDKIKGELDDCAPAHIVLELFPEYFVGVNKEEIDKAHTYLILKNESGEKSLDEKRTAPCRLSELLNMRSIINGHTLLSNWYVAWTEVLRAHHVGYKL